MSSTAQEILEIQRKLKGLGFYKGALDGVRGPLTKAAEAAYEASKHASTLFFAERITLIARGEVGNQESPRGSNTGPEILKYFEADWLEMGGKTDGYAWCASFVCWVVREAIKQHQAAGGKVAFSRPQTAGAHDFENWARSQSGKGVWLIKPAEHPRPGDIVVFRASHIGIVSEAGNASLRTVEGNTNPGGSREGYAVLERYRSLSECRSFIRLS